MGGAPHLRGWRLSFRLPCVRSYFDLKTGRWLVLDPWLTWMFEAGGPGVFGRYFLWQSKSLLTKEAFATSIFGSLSWIVQATRWLRRAGPCFSLRGLRIEGPKGPPCESLDMAEPAVKRHPKHPKTTLSFCSVDQLIAFLRLFGPTILRRLPGLPTNDQGLALGYISLSASGRAHDAPNGKGRRNGRKVSRDLAKGTMERKEGAQERFGYSEVSFLFHGGILSKRFSCKGKEQWTQ